MSIIVVRFNAHDELSNSRPCAFCTKLIQILGFNRCIYSTEDGSLEITKTKDLKGGDTTSGYKRFMNNEVIKYKKYKYHN